MRPLSPELLLLALGVLALSTGRSIAWDAWFVDSTTKVMLDDPPGTAKVAQLSAAGNEFEAVQLVIRAGDEPLHEVSVAVTDLVGPDGATIGQDRIEVLRVAYVYLPARDRGYPDPLPPWTPCDVFRGQNQPAWIDIYVPPDATPGLYRATVSVTAAGAPLVELPIELTVRDFALPVTPRSRCSFGVYTQGIEAQHHVAAGSPEYSALLTRYYEMLVSHRATPSGLAFGVQTPATERYLNDPRVNAFIIPYSSDDAELKAWVDTIREKGWIDKGYFYVVDEPIQKDQFDLLKRHAERIHALGADLKIVSPYFREPAFEAEGGVHGLLTGVCGIWCPKVHFYNEEFLTKRQALGEEVWWYVCWEPGAPYANLYVDMAGVDHRALFWQQAHYNVDGFLYWTTTYWEANTGTADPWTDMATVKNLSPSVYGDGSVLYPGSKVGIDGPVASIRLKLIREGLEDVEYLRMLEDREGRDAVREVTSQVVQGLDAYSKDASQYGALREAVARRLEGGG